MNQLHYQLLWTWLMPITKCFLVITIFWSLSSLFFSHTFFGHYSITHLCCRASPPPWECLWARAAAAWPRSSGRGTRPRAERGARSLASGRNTRIGCGRAGSVAAGHPAWNTHCLGSGWSIRFRTEYSPFLFRSFLRESKCSSCTFWIIP